MERPPWINYGSKTMYRIMYTIQYDREAKYRPDINKCPEYLGNPCETKEQAIKKMGLLTIWILNPHLAARITRFNTIPPNLKMAEESGKRSAERLEKAILEG